MKPRTVVLVPGYNEPDQHFDVLIEGKDGIAGLQAYGFDCVKFPPQDDRLRDRIDRFAYFIEQLEAQGYSFPIVLLGYSLGGLVVRGYLRAYPERAHQISHTIMVAAPNWGLEVLPMKFITQMLRVPDKAMGDMNLNSDFMNWLNGTPGRYIRTGFLKREWTLDREPIIAPPGAKILGIMGLIPQRGCGHDGLVDGDSATLASRIPTHFVVGPHCNHMNIIGHFDPLVTLTTGFLANDRVWPHTLQAILRFTEAKLTPAEKAS